MPSWMEWMGEEHNPGEMGAITFRFGAPPRRSSSATLISLVITLAVLGVAYHALFTYMLPLTGRVVMWTAIVSLIYLAIAYVFRPEPSRENLGWFGGMIDNPFRYSDDINRSLLWVSILLWPGRAAGDALVGAILLPFRTGDEGLTTEDTENTESF